MATTRFCPLPANFGGNTYKTSKLAANKIKSVTDRRWDTFSSEGTLILDTTSNPRVTHLWVKGTGITEIQARSSGTLVASQVIADFSVQNAQGHDVAINADGFDNILLPLTGAPLTTTQLDVTISGTNRKVTEIAAIDALIEIDAEERFSQMDFTPVWRGMTTHRPITGRIKSVPPVNKEPYRYNVDMTILYLNNASHQPLINFLYENPNFCLIPEYTRYPNVCLLEATLPNWELQIRNLIEDLKIHQSLSLTVWES